MGTLYVVATPIGNLEDMTDRAKTVLSSVFCIAAEDTRVTKKLLDHYEIHTPVRSYHAQSSKKAEDDILLLLGEGKDVALVSDAGTPGISDPGVLLVARARQEGNTVVSVPGASALTAALSIAGVPTHTFTFLGFLPHKKGRNTLFEFMKDTKHTVVFYESPHRIMKTLASLVEYLPSTMTVTICRELTKMYEEVVQGTPEEVLQHFTQNEESIRGEFVVLISPGTIPA